MICEIRTANNPTGDYQPCDQPATRITRFGLLSCEEHGSIADMLLTEISKDELAKRLIYREIPIEGFESEVFLDPELGVVQMGATK